MKIKQGLEINTVDMHTEGGIVRIITGGYPPICGSTILEKMSFIRKNYDQLRTLLMLEPRGHDGMFGALLVEPDHSDAATGVIFLHNQGYGTMCGHAVLAVARYIVDTRLSSIDKEQSGRQINISSIPVAIQCPSGIINATVNTDLDQRDVKFLNVPSFAYATDVSVQTGDHGLVHFDIAYGGVFYAIVEDKALNLSLLNSSCHDIVDAGIKFRTVVQEHFSVKHPHERALSFLYGVIIKHTNTDGGSQRETYNVCIFGQNQADRSPCGTGSSACVALEIAKGTLSLGEERIFRNALTKSRFIAKAISSTTCGPFDAVQVEISGRTHYTGKSTFTFENDDEFKYGFLVK